MVTMAAVPETPPEPNATTAGGCVTTVRAMVLEVYTQVLLCHCHIV